MGIYEKAEIKATQSHTKGKRILKTKGSLVFKDILHRL